MPVYQSARLALGALGAIANQGDQETPLSDRDRHEHTWNREPIVLAPFRQAVFYRRRHYPCLSGTSHRQPGQAAPIVQPQETAKPMAIVLANAQGGLKP